MTQLTKEQWHFSGVKVVLSRHWVPGREKYWALALVGSRIRVDEAKEASDHMIARRHAGEIIGCRGDTKIYVCKST